MQKNASSELIRVSGPTKEILSSLKLIESESFDAVITRLLDTRLEEMLELSRETKKLLTARSSNVRAGKVFSSKELLERVRKQKG